MTTNAAKYFYHQERYTWDAVHTPHGLFTYGDSNRYATSDYDNFLRIRKCNPTDADTQWKQYTTSVQLSVINGPNKTYFTVPGGTPETWNINRTMQRSVPINDSGKRFILVQVCTSPGDYVSPNQPVTIDNVGHNALRVLLLENTASDETSPDGGWINSASNVKDVKLIDISALAGWPQLPLVNKYIQYQANVLWYNLTRIDSNTWYLLGVGSYVALGQTDANYLPLFRYAYGITITVNGDSLSISSSVQSANAATEAQSNFTGYRSALPFQDDGTVYMNGMTADGVPKSIAYAGDSVSVVSYQQNPFAWAESALIGSGMTAGEYYTLISNRPNSPPPDVFCALDLHNRSWGTRYSDRQAHPRISNHYVPKIYKYDTNGLSDLNIVHYQNDAVNSAWEGAWGGSGEIMASRPEYCISHSSYDVASERYAHFVWSTQTVTIPYVTRTPVAWYADGYDGTGWIYDGNIGISQSEIDFPGVSVLIKQQQPLRFNQRDDGHGVNQGNPIQPQYHPVMGNTIRTPGSVW